MAYNDLINWYQDVHTNYQGENHPLDEGSTLLLTELSNQILEPIKNHFGELQITYGFTSHKLLNYIKKNSPGDMDPRGDQHAALELNSIGNKICNKRDGAACDIYVTGYENQMHIIAEFVINKLPFDRLYFYGSDRPIHISFGPEHSRYLHVKHRDEHGKRNVGKGATGDKGLTLLENSI